MKMSTYLIALVVSDYDLSTTKTAPYSNAEIRVAAPLGVVNHGLVDYALECSVKAIDYFSEYYQYNYSEPFGKCG